jgi:hypothetical protein
MPFVARRSAHGSFESSIALYYTFVFPEFSLERWCRR